MKRYLRIGELAQRTGVSAKALRLYEQRGLLRPCSHSDKGYRLYGVPALDQLRRIVLLRRSCFSLSEISQLLEKPDSVSKVVALKIAAMEHRLTQTSAALMQLRHWQQQLEQTSIPDDPSSIDRLMEHINMTHTLDVALTEAERADLNARAAAIGPEGLAAAEQAWSLLIAQVRLAMERGLASDHAEVQILAQRWHALIQQFTGGDSGLAQKLGEAYQRQPAFAAAQGLDAALFAYIGAAMVQSGLRMS